MLHATNHSVNPTVIKGSVRFYITVKGKNNKIKYYSYDYFSLIWVGFIAFLWHSKLEK